MNIETYLTQHIQAVVGRLYPQAAGVPLQIQRTRREFEGDYTLVVFPLLKASRKSPEATATEIGDALVADSEIASFEAEDVYNQKDATGFIRLNALRLSVMARSKQAAYLTEK